MVVPSRKFGALILILVFAMLILASCGLIGGGGEEDAEADTEVGADARAEDEPGGERREVALRRFEVRE